MSLVFDLDLNEIILEKKIRLLWKLDVIDKRLQLLQRDEITRFIVHIESYALK